MKQFKHGSRLATVENQNGKWVVWCGFECNNGETIPARRFKGNTTCSNSYVSEKRAIAEAEKFVMSGLLA